MTIISSKLFEVSISCLIFAAEKTYKNDFSTHLYYSRTRRASFGQQSDVRWLRV